jgi:hypothetical protein
VLGPALHRWLTSGGRQAAQALLDDALREADAERQASDVSLLGAGVGLLALPARRSLDMTNGLAEVISIRPFIFGGRYWD